MSVKIKKINIHAFRGIPDLELELEGKSLLLGGENETGKSSIVESIEFFFTGKVSHLEGIQGLSLRRHGTHVNFRFEDVNVGITFDPGNVFLSRTFTSAPSPSPPLEEYFQITQKGTFILRRSQILEFIMSQPADRFRAIGSIIGIEPLDNVELEMMRVRDELSGKVISKGNDVERLIKELSVIIGKDITSTDVIVSLLNDILGSANLPLIKSLEDVDKHAEEMLKSVKKVEILDKIKVLNEILETTKIQLITEETVKELDSLNKKIRHLLQDKVRFELSVGNLLETGRRIIEQEKLEVCPLCEQRIVCETLLARIDARRTTLLDLSNKASEIRRISVPVIDSLKGVSNNLGVLISKIELFPELSKEKEILLGIPNSLNILIEKVVSGKDLQNEIPVREIVQQRDEINRIISSISKISNQLLKDIGLTQEEKRVLEIVLLIERARSKTKDISKTNIELKTNQKYLELAEKIYSAFSETKKTKIQEIYNIIQADMQSFYSMLHPNGLHKNIELTVALGRRASTEIKIESFGRKGEDPRALTSEGHLDSLGLCIFLAFVKKFNESCSLIVLDDIVTTVDSRHRENACKLLLEKFGDKQLVITTHDDVWYEQLSASLRAYQMDGNFKKLSIVSWDINTGPKIIPYKPRWERIQEKIASGDKTGAGNEGRQYLEWILKRVCEVTNAPVPIKNWLKGMVGDILPHAKQRFESLVKDELYKKKVENAFTEVERTTILGNILSHDNPLADKVSMNEVDRFCKCVDELHKAFLCPNCEHFIGYFPELKIIRCSNTKCENPIEVKCK